MAVVMRQPRSYTREDVVEIHCHGGYFAIKNILDTLIGAGARLAEPGEFTLRAFLNGRIDLTEAEAVIDLIQARSERGARNAVNHLKGDMFSTLSGIRSGLVDVLALLEAYLDFPEEEVTAPHHSDIATAVQTGKNGVEKILKSFNFGRMLKEGLSILLLGKPNVGKSSLLNFMIGEKRAIVHELPGTTRDVIEERIILDGFPLKVIDTAGIRDSDDPVEIEGVNRSRDKLDLVDLVLFMVDGSCPLTAEDLAVFKLCPKNKTILVINKADLGIQAFIGDFYGVPSITVSVLEGSGLDELKKLILRHFGEAFDKGETGESVILSSERQYQALVSCYESLGRVESGLDSDSPFEMLALDLREAIYHFGEVTGETLTEEVLGRIFSQFCIGK